jgi:hypothetical protein
MIANQHFLKNYHQPHTSRQTGTKSEFMIAEQKSQKNETVNNTYDRPATMVIIHLLSSWETDKTMKCNPLNREKNTDKSGNGVVELTQGVSCGCEERLPGGGEDPDEEGAPEEGAVLLQVRQEPAPTPVRSSQTDWRNRKYPPQKKFVFSRGGCNLEAKYGKGDEKRGGCERKRKKEER